MFTTCRYCHSPAWQPANAALCESCYRAVLDHVRKSLVNSRTTKRDQTWSARQRKLHHEAKAVNFTATN